MKNEIWKDIKDYEGLYQVSSLGNVKKLERIAENLGTFGGVYHHKEKLLSPRKNTKRNDYLEISLYKNKKEKRFKLHRLVAQMFIPNPYNLPQVNHIDGNKNNNCIDNLEWVTDLENKKHAWSKRFVQRKT